MIAEDTQLSKLLFSLAKSHPELEAITQNLSIATFRFVPVGFIDDNESKKIYLNTLNEALLK